MILSLFMTWSVQCAFRPAADTGRSGRGRARQKYSEAAASFADCLHNDAAGASVGDQGGGELQDFALNAWETVRDLEADIHRKVFFIGIGNTDQALFIYTCFLQAGYDCAHSGFPGSAHGHKGNSEVVLCLCKDREKMQGTADSGGHIRDPSALSKIIKIGRNHIGYG